MEPLFFGHTNIKRQSSWITKWCASFLCCYEHRGILAGFMQAVINAADSTIRSTSSQDYPGNFLGMRLDTLRSSLPGLCLSAEGHERRPGASSVYLESKRRVLPLLCSGRERKQGWGIFARTRKQVPETFQLNSEPFLCKGNRMLCFIFRVNCKLSSVFIYFLFVRKNKNNPKIPSPRHCKACYKFNCI